MSTWILHCQIVSPFGVQDFIAGARRIRDYWAGSFLTAWLAARAMKAVCETGGEIVFPHPEHDPLWRALDDPGSTWRVGTVPNRFKARIADPGTFRPNGDDPCSAAVREAWQGLAEAVWETFLRDVADGKTRAIWNRQIDHFWEVSWVLGEDPGDGSDGRWLDRRKNWRTQVPNPEEPADHCRIFGQLQELSGHARARGEAEAQNRFWQGVREKIRREVDPNARDAAFELLELRATERLSAPALVKRLFPCLAADRLREVFGWIPGGGAGAFAGIRYWPSTPYMAAIPWMIDVSRTVPEDARKFADEVRRQLYVPAVAERHVPIRSLEQPAEFGNLDGGLFFDEMLETEARNLEREAELSSAGTPAAEMLRGRAESLVEIRKRLAELQKTYRDAVSAGRSGRGRRRFDASPFYALLLMDGDAIGRMLSQAVGEGLEKEVSEGLRRFGERVPGIVEAYDGVLVYAGGDDVAAFLPLTRALPCTLELRRAYLGATGTLADGLGYSPTISAGLVFAHAGVPLASVVREAHRLLAEVAKEDNGRNSIAISVLKPSGRMAEYVTGFVSTSRAPDQGAPVDGLQALARAYAAEPERSTGFLYKVRERYGEMLQELDLQTLEQVLFAEWVLGRSLSEVERERERERVRQLMGVCLTVRGDGGGCPIFRIEGGLIARFLADQGVGTFDHAEPAGAREAGP